MKPNLPNWARTAIYVFTLLGTPVVGYANAKGWIGKDEIQLWGAEVSAAGTLAAVHVRNIVQSSRRNVDPVPATVGSSGRLERATSDKD